jgi:hypothetical protein
MRTGLFDGMMVISSSIMVLLLMIIFLLLVVGEIKGYGDQGGPEEGTTLQNGDWERKAIEDRKRLMESLANRPAVHRMFEGYQPNVPKVPRAQVMDHRQLGGGSSSQAITKYQPPKEEPMAKKEIERSNLDEDLEDIEEWDDFEEVEN